VQRDTIARLQSFPKPGMGKILSLRRKLGVCEHGVSANEGGLFRLLGSSRF
jgi:hypothetical protein